MKFVIAVIIFSVVILIHELGHFLLAKKNHIEVLEFSLGMGPRIISTVKGGTRYSVKLFPLGGSCAMAGEDAEDDSPGTFNSAPVWGRIAVVAAGPIFNFLLAFVLSVIITEYQGYHIDLGKDLYVYSYLNELKEGDTIRLKVKRDGKEQEISYKPDVNVRYLLGFNRSDVNSMTVESLIKGMPLEEAGLEAGDVITKINGVEVPDGNAYEKYIEEHPLSKKPVTITYERNGLEYEAEITPREYRTPVSGFGYNTYSEKTSGFNVLKYGAVEVKYMIRTTILSLKELVTGHLGMKDLSGPVGIADAIGDTYEQSKSEGTLMIWMNLLNMAVLLSANLGVMNLLPLPALDGGRLVFLVAEAIRRKPVNRQVEGMIHFAGLMLLMALMVIVMYNDILKIF